MKPKKTALRLTGQRRETETLRQRLSLLLPAVPIFLGLWGLGQEIQPGDPAWALLGLCALSAVILLSWKSAWQRLAALGLCAAGLGVCLVFREELTDGLAALAGSVGALLTRRTGYYYPPYTTGGMNPLTAGLLSLLLGALTGAAVRHLRGIPHFLCALGLLALSLGGIPEAGAWLALYLAGTLLLLVHFSAGAGKPVAAAALLIGLLGGLFTWAGAVPDWSAGGRALSAKIHALRYEPASNPLPEGDLENLGAFTPGQEPALEITMDTWRPLYIRGFVGSVYTDRGWEPTDPEALAEQAELLYVLQRDYFSPAVQMGAAAGSLESQETARFALKVLDACRANAYVPYGADALETDPRALLGEGLSPGRDLTGTLYAVEDSYLVQAALSAGAGDSSYTDGEAAYRAWVYAQYLEVPEEAYRLLAAQFTLPQEAMTTAQARQQVQALLDVCLTYDESAVMSTGGKPFLEYLLTINPRGYSVQYATLATLLMRCCGVPARYVEGYLLSQTMAAQAEPGEPLVLTQACSHAWAEIYLDGVGWIPFDTTPNHKNEIVYTLPSQGGSQETGQLSQTGQLLPQTQQQEIPIRQEGRQDRSAGAGKWPAWALWLLPGLALLLGVLRTVLLRRRLRRRIAAFRTGEARAGSLDCLVYTGEILTHMGLPRRNVPLTRRGPEIAALLAPVEEEEVEAVLSLAAELRFSGHRIDEASRTRAIEAMEAVRACWRRKTGLPGRIWAQWIQCSIL